MSDIADDLRAVMEGPVDGGENKGVIERDASTNEPLVKEVPEARDTSGRFAPKVPATNEVPTDKEPAAKEQVTPEEGQEAALEGQAAAPAALASKAPISWKPEIREEWAKLPATVQQEVMRREREVDTVLRISADSRKFYDQFVQTVTPYEAILRSENAHPLAAINELFKTAAALRTAPAPDRATLVADMIMRFGVDINLLDEALATRAQNPGARQTPAPAFDPRMIDQALEQRESQRQQQMIQSHVQQEWDTFAAKPEFEFADDLREEIAGLLEIASRRNQILSLSDAYKRAILLHPTIAGIVQQRQQASNSAQQTAAARRAKEAAASIGSGAPSRGGEGEEDDGDIRSAITASVRKLSSSR